MSAEIGVASVIDRATLEIRGQRIRLHGIDAAESDQICVDAAGQKWRGGQRSSHVTVRRPMRSCNASSPRDVDRYGRVASRCSVGEADINEWLVLQGLALAYRKYSRDYMAAEKPAPPATGCGSARSRRGNGGTGADREIAGRVIGDDETGRRVIAIAIDE